MPTRQVQVLPRIVVILGIYRGDSLADGNAINVDPRQSCRLHADRRARLAVSEETVA
jgi:hypothetical protein